MENLETQKQTSESEEKSKSNKIVYRNNLRYNLFIE